MLVAFTLAALFNAPAMKKTALELPFGTQRDFRLHLVEPLASLSEYLFLDRPAALIADLAGRPDPGGNGGTPAVAATPRPTPSASSTKELTPAELPLRRPTRSRPLRVYFAGDSMAGIPGMVFINLARETRVVKTRLDYRASSGLVRPDFFNWPAQLKRQVRALDPGAVIVMWGANDTQGIQTDEGKVYQFGTRGWRKEYRQRVDDVIALLFDGGVQRIYWVGQPPMAEASFDRKVRLENDIYRASAEKHPGVQYIDAYEVMSGRDGYAQYLRDGDGDVQQVREGDGIHMTYAGGLRLATAIMAAIEAEWLPKPKPIPEQPDTSDT
jgi:hypothetical protein